MPSPLIIQASLDDEMCCGDDQALCSEVIDEAQPVDAARRMHGRTQELKTTHRQALENSPQQAIEPIKEETHCL